MIIDTHSHIYDTAFDGDIDDVVARARQVGVERIVLPGIDKSYNERMFALAASDTALFCPTIGLHPTSVNDNAHWRQELDVVEQVLKNPPVERIYAIGEVGLDLYWSREWLKEQTEAFVRQIELAMEYDLPIIIHTRDAWQQMCEILVRYKGCNLKLIIHAFAGSEQDYRVIRECGQVVFGIGGVVTYKNSGIASLLPLMTMQELVLETDAPYLTPVPHRGKRNESSYITIVCDRIAQIMGTTSRQVACQTTANAKRILSL